MRLITEKSRRYYHLHKSGEYLEDLIKGHCLGDVILDKYSVFFAVVSSIWRGFPSVGLRMLHYHGGFKDEVS